MIRKIVMWLFGKEIRAERERIISEARAVLEETKKHSKKIYLPYDRINPGTEDFLRGIRVVIENRYLISWLNECKMQWMAVIKTAIDENNRDQVCLVAAKVSMIDDIFGGLQSFENKYIEMLNQKKEEQNETGFRTERNGIQE